MEKFIPTPTISEILKEEFMDPLGLLHIDWLRIYMCLFHGFKKY